MGRADPFTDPEYTWREFVWDVLVLALIELYVALMRLEDALTRPRK